MKIQFLIFFIIIIFPSIFIYSQDLNSLRYNDAEQDLKEFLAIQALLSENRMKELINFLEEYQYESVGENDIGLQYIKIKENYKINDIMSTLYIRSGGVPDGIADNHIAIFFGIISGVDPLNVEWVYNDLYADAINNLFKSKIEIGYNYFMFDQIETNESVKVEKIDRYTKKLTSISDPEFIKIVKASNFYTFDEWPNRIAFSGPGKTSGTTIEFKKSGNDSGSFSIVSISSILYNNPNSLKPFNLDFFMNLKNFNDRIWADEN